MLPTVLSGHFPAPRPGPHKRIGYAFLSCPASTPYTRESPRFKHNGAPALNLTDIGYAVFYPAEPVKKGWFGRGDDSVDWLASPKKEVVAGYKQFLGDRAYWVLIQIMRVFMTRMKFTASPLAPLSSTPTDNKATTHRYPLVIFSHGLAGTRTTYAQYCAALASEGYVVLSIEHKDGSGPAVSVPAGYGDGPANHSGTSTPSSINSIRDKTQGGYLHYTRHQDLEWECGEQTSLLDFRSLQLQLRVREVYETYHTFKRIVSGDLVPTVHDTDATGRGVSFLASLRARVELDKVALTGHSFGGATILSILQSSPAPTYSPLPITHTIALDPWLEPLPTPTASTSSPTSPLLVLNSPGFTIWSNHFERLVQVVKSAGGWLGTVMNGNHQSFSDFPLLLPPAAKSAKFLATTHALSVAFLRDRLGDEELLSAGKTMEDGGKVDKDEKGKMRFKGDVALHLRGK